jgi:hypothetical protein
MGGFGLLDVVMNTIFILTAVVVFIILRPLLGLVFALLVALVVGWVTMMAIAFVLARIDRWPGQLAPRDHRNERRP